LAFGRGTTMTATFEAYAIEELVAEGATVTVWRARHTELGRLVAIKALSPRLRADPEAVAALRREARQLTELDDPHIVSVYDFVDDDPEQPYLVTEWVDGQTLLELLARVGQLRPEQSLGVLRGALQGLAYAHRRGLVHGDISPSNMVLDRSGTTKLIDFGLAAPAGGSGVSGTPAYLSPEAAAGRPLLPASDVYSAAAVLFHLLSGRPLFSGKDVFSTIRAHRDDLPPPLQDHGPELSRLLDRALLKDPSARPADAAEFLAELEDAATARYGPGWLAGASVAGLVGVGAAGGLAAATAAGGAAAGSAAAGSAGTSAAASTTTIAANGLATATADTGAALPTGAVLKGGRRGGRLGRAVTTHPIVAGVVSVVVVAAATTTAVLASSGKSKPPPPPEAILLASSPQGAFTATGAITSTTDPQLKVRKLGSFPWTITEKCNPKSCDAVVKSPGSDFRFAYAGQAFSSTTTNQSRVTCVTPQGKKVAGSTALEHHSVVWTLKVVTRAPATADGPGRALVLSGTALETTTYSDLTGNCQDNVGKKVTRYSYTVRRK
jgi:hypothetical protein